MQIFNLKNISDQEAHTRLCKFLINTIIPRYQKSIKDLSPEQRNYAEHIIESYLRTNNDISFGEESVSLIVKELFKDV